MLLATESGGRPCCCALVGGPDHVEMVLCAHTKGRCLLAAPLPRRSAANRGQLYNDGPNAVARRLVFGHALQSCLRFRVRPLVRAACALAHVLHAQSRLSWRVSLHVTCTIFSGYIIYNTKGWRPVQDKSEVSNQEPTVWNSQSKPSLEILN